jgi:O-antigen ligase
MGYANGGYFVGEWALVAIILAALALSASVAGAFRRTESRWSTVALGLFVAYTAWTFASLLWSPNRGDAWLGAGQTTLYLMTFWLAVSLVSLGASRLWILVASALGPAIVASLTLLALVPHLQGLFDSDGGRLFGTVGYPNGEAAFLLVPFWVAVYLVSSPSLNPILRGVALAGSVLSVEVVVLTQSRGAMVAMAVSLPVFFLISGQRLRRLFALIPIVAALLATFPMLNEVYLGSSSQESAAAAIERVLPIVWLTAAGAGLYGMLWGLIDRQRWQPPRSVTRIIGGVALAVSIAVLVFSAAVVSEHVGTPLTWGEQKRGTFKANDRSSQEQSRFLNVSGSGRYTLWQVGWEDFASHPLLGIGTQNYEATYYRLREQPGGYPRQPHALPLEVLSERGLVGGVLFFGFVAACLSSGLRERFGHLDSEGKAQLGAMSAALTYWFVHSSSEWFWQLPAVTLPAVVYLAMLVGPWRRIEAAPPRWPLRAVGAGVAVLAIAVIAPLYAADRYLARSFSTTNASEALVNVERAQRFNPLSPELFQREAKLAMLAGDWARAEKAYTEETRLNPEHYAPYVLLARYYERVGKPEEALSSYRNALALNPLDEQLSEEAVGRHEPYADPAMPDPRDPCHTPTQSGAYQNCPPEARGSIYASR